MADSPKSEASHHLEPATGKSHGVKDKECQYCHQHFTSSSLGRHLDLFIFRKKADGIHNVDEIQTLRRRITRRTTKAGANAKQDGEGSQSTPHNASPVNRDSPAAERHLDLNATPVEGYRVRLNVPNWQSTGVINGLPGSSTASPALENVFSTTTTGKRSYSSIETAAAKDTLGLRGDLGSDKDTARALELALREVLDTIQAAHVKTKPLPSPFPIDIQSHTFPSLVLNLLPHPPTLLTSPTPFTTPDSFPLSSPPDHTHLHLLRSTLTSLTTTISSSSSIISTATSHTATALSHLDLAYNHYASLPLSQQQQIWQIELARAFALERQKKKELQDSLDAVMAEARQLNGQVEYLSRCQWPREMALFPPERRPIRSHLIREMANGAGREAKRRRRTPTPPPPRGQDRAADAVRGGREDEDEGSDDEDGERKRWDYDVLLSKWKKVVREDSVRRRGLALPVPVPVPVPIPVSASPSTIPVAGSATNGTTTTTNTTTLSTSNGHHHHPAATNSASTAPPSFPTPTSTPTAHLPPTTTTSAKNKNSDATATAPPCQPHTKKAKFITGEPETEDASPPVPQQQQQQHSSKRRIHSHGSGGRHTRPRSKLRDHLVVVAAATEAGAGATHDPGGGGGEGGTREGCGYDGYGYGYGGHNSSHSSQGGDGRRGFAYGSGVGVGIGAGNGNGNGRVCM